MLKKINWYPCILSLLTLLFFVFGEGPVGYVIGGDSQAFYIHFNHNVEVMPLYPLFFHVLNLIFGESLYLYAAAVIQIALLTVCVMYFVLFIRKQFGLGMIYTFIVWGGALIPFVLLLPEDPLGHTLMTESLTYPLTYLFITVILKGIYEKRAACFYYGLLLVVIMTLIRGQMKFLIVTAVVAFVYMMISDSAMAGKKKFYFSLLFLTVVFIGMQSINWLRMGYEKIFFDAPAQDFSAKTLASRLLYVSDPEDKDLFEDEIAAEIFEKIYMKMEEKKSNYKYETGGLLEWREIVKRCGANNYIVAEEIDKYFGYEKSAGDYNDDYIKREALWAVYSKEIVNTLLKAHWKDHLFTSFRLIPAGFISTVLFHKESIYGLIHIATLLLYLLGTGGSVFCYFKGNRKTAEYMFLIVGTAVTNGMATNLIHVGLQRYLAYTVGLFWVGMALLTYDIWKRTWKGKKSMDAIH